MIKIIKNKKLVITIWSIFTALVAIIGVWHSWLTFTDIPLLTTKSHNLIVQNVTKTLNADLTFRYHLLGIFEFSVVTFSVIVLVYGIMTYKMSTNADYIKTY